MKTMIVEPHLPEKTAAPPGSTMQVSLKLVAIGDCNTSGQFNHTNVPTALQALLEKEGIGCSLSNLGAAMNTSREGVAKAHDHTLKADMLLLSFGLVDAWVTTIPMFYVSYYPDSKLKRRTRKLLKSLKKRLRHPLLKQCVPTGPVVKKKEFEQNIERIIAIFRERNPNTSVVLWGAAPTDDDHRNALLRDYNAALSSVAVRNGGGYLDTERVLTNTERSLMFDDAVHLSSQACDKIAEALLPYVLTKLRK